MPSPTDFANLATHYRDLFAEAATWPHLTIGGEARDAILHDHINSLFKKGIPSADIMHVVDMWDTRNLVSAGREEIARLISKVDHSFKWEPKNTTLPPIEEEKTGSYYPCIIPYDENFVWLPSLEVPGDMEWIWRGVIARGRATLLSSPESGGKSTLLAYLLWAMENTSDPSLCTDITPTKTLIVTEEHLGNWSKRRDLLGGDWGHVAVLRAPRMATRTLAGYRGFLDRLGEWSEEYGFGMIVWDVFASIVRLITQENDNMEMLRAAEETETLREKLNLAMLWFHHMKKALTEDGRGYRGASSLAGNADIIVELRKVNLKDRQDNRRRLLISGRIFEDNYQELRVAMDLETFKFEGLAPPQLGVSDRQHDRQEAIRSILPPQRPGLTAFEVLKRWPSSAGKLPSIKTLKDLLSQGVSADLWTRSGKGARGHEFRYFQLPCGCCPHEVTPVVDEDDPYDSTTTE